MEQRLTADTFQSFLEHYETNGLQFDGLQVHTKILRNCSSTPLYALVMLVVANPSDASVQGTLWSASPTRARWQIFRIIIRVVSGLHPSGARKCGIRLPGKRNSGCCRRRHVNAIPAPRRRLVFAGRARSACNRTWNGTESILWASVASAQK